MLCFSSCLIIHSLVCQYSLVTIDTAIIRSSHQEMFCRKGALANFAKFTRKHQKEIPLQMFSGNSTKFLITRFLKNPSDGCFCINTGSVLFSYHNLSPFQKRCHTYFLPEYFFGLICRLGTKVSSYVKPRPRNLFSI